MAAHNRLARLLVLLAGAAATVATARAQTTTSAPPAFEVASIKKNVSGGDNASLRAQPGGRVVVTNHTLRNMIRNAFNVQNYQIVGGPDWINEDRWDIVAKAATDADPQQLLLMVRALLVDRFKLDIRNEAREMPVYALVLARADGRLGPQLRTSTIDCVALYAAAGEKRQEPPRDIHGRPACGTRTTRGSSFDLDLTWAGEPPPPGPDGAVPQASLSGDGVSLFTAVQEQLGLKLDARRAPVDVIAIEAAERPAEN